VADGLGPSGGPGGATGAKVEDRIRSAREGSRVAMEELLSVYRNYVSVLAGAAIGRGLQAKVDASDVAQETLLKAHQGFPDFRGATEAELLAWLRRVLARTIADQVRRYAGTEGRRVSRERSIDASVGDSVERSSAALKDVLAADITSPSMAVSKREAGAALADALAALDPDHRQVIVLRNLEEREWAEVAQRMGRTPDAARMLWARALARLRPLLETRP
jgi:RNA polymerase sigma-70 factor (ECF subfamily)